MGYPLTLALRYLGSKKRASISVGTAFAMLGVTLGVAALSIVMSVTGGFQQQFRDKVLGVNAHVLVLKYSIDFREYRSVMMKAETVPGVIGVAPFIINPMMVTHGARTATGVLLKGVDPALMPKVLDLPKHIVEPRDLVGPGGVVDEARAAEYLMQLRRPGAKPPERSDNGRFDPDVFPPLDADGGEPELSDAGTQSLLDAIRQEIARVHDDAGATEPTEPTEPTDPAPAPTTLLPGSPVGSVTPNGGFKSKLPDRDVLPEEIDPDPCKSPTEVARLPGVVLGRTLARQLDIGIGDCVQITSPTIGISIGASGTRPPIAKQFRVIAIFEAGFDQYDSKLVYTDLFEAQTFYDQGDSVTGVEMKVADIDNTREICQALDKLLANSVYHTLDWKELNHGLFTALLIQKIGMSFVLAMIIVLAAFTVVATLIMVVLDKKREVALLKALGARNDAVLRVFLYQGGIIGLVGTALGLCLGYLGCIVLRMYGFPLDPKVYFISQLPVEIRTVEFVLTGVVSVFICLIATLFPALYAALLRPADGLRAE